MPYVLISFFTKRNFTICLYTMRAQSHMHSAGLWRPQIAVHLFSCSANRAGIAPLEALASSKSTLMRQMLPWCRHHCVFWSKLLTEGLHKINISGDDIVRGSTLILPNGRRKSPKEIRRHDNHPLLVSGCKGPSSFTPLQHPRTDGIIKFHRRNTFTFWDCGEI